MFFRSGSMEEKTLALAQTLARQASLASDTDSPPGSPRTARTHASILQDKVQSFRSVQSPCYWFFLYSPFLCPSFCILLFFLLSVSSSFLLYVSSCCLLSVSSYLPVFFFLYLPTLLFVSSFLSMSLSLARSSFSLLLDPFLLVLSSYYYFFILFLLSIFFVSSSSCFL